MKRFILFFPVLLLTCSASLKADEGMWLLPLIQKLNIDTMHSLGLRLSAEDIYSINHSSLKDAIVMFDGGCTGEIVSEEGLLLTNHHCGYDAIQNHSTTEHNYLRDGYWAANHGEELPNPGMTVTFLVRMEDVTDVILAALQDTMKESSRNSMIEAISDSISRASSAGTHYEAVVESFFGGNNFYLLVYENFKDIRLVGAPPSAIGKFGHDTDNWVWPRHTGDFSVFRVYSDKDGMPAEFNTSNIPLKPKHALSISLRGAKNNDFSMILGYPGSTDRYMSSWEIREMSEITNPNRVKIRGLRQDILLKDMSVDEKIDIQYASKYSISSNYWKYSIGQNQGLKKLKIIELKEEQEKEFTNWVNADEQRKQKFADALGLIKNAVEGRAQYQHALQYTYETFFSASEITAFANRATYLYITLLRDPGNRVLIDSLTAILRKNWEEFNNEYSVTTDRKVVPAVMRLFSENVPAMFHPDFFATVKSKYKGDFDLYAQNMFSKSIFSNPDKMAQFLKQPTAKMLGKDPAFVAARSALDIYRIAYLGLNAFDEEFEKGHRLYVAGLMEMNKDKVFYPDANSTMRLTYGTVKDYIPRDAVHYDYYTTMDGVMEKEDPENWEFVVPEKLKELYKAGDFGQYGVDGKMPVCFITTNDITGGNSGSPVIDGEGNLLGLAFDGNWEAMAGDVVFEPALQRCICVDIRYVLFIMDKYAGASHLIDEMKIVR